MNMGNRAPISTGIDQNDRASHHHRHRLLLRHRRLLRPRAGAGRLAGVCHRAPDGDRGAARKRRHRNLPDGLYRPDTDIRLGGRGVCAHAAAGSTRCSTTAPTARPARSRTCRPKRCALQFETNVIGWHDLTRQVIPAMRAQGHGRIVQCSSILGIVPYRWRGAYNASKFALEGLTLTMRMELARQRHRGKPDRAGADRIALHRQCRRLFRALHRSEGFGARGGISSGRCDG